MSFLKSMAAAAPQTGQFTVPAFRQPSYESLAMHEPEPQTPLNMNEGLGCNRTGPTKELQWGRVQTSYWASDLCGTRQLSVRVRVVDNEVLGSLGHRSCSMRFVSESM